MNVGYERLDNLIAVSALSQKDLDTLKVLFIDSCDMCICFSEYVKSQVHLNMSAGLYKRPLRLYINALRFLNGNKAYEEDALKVLRYFYNDIALFLINNVHNIKAKVIIDTNMFNLEETVYDVSSVKLDLLDVVQNCTLSTLDNFKFAEIIDAIEDAETLQNKLDSYAVASILLYASKDKLTIVKLEDTNYDFKT